MTPAPAPVTRQHRVTKSPLRAANLMLAVLLEVTLLFAFADWGFHLHAATAVKWVFGIGVAAVTVVLWAVLAAPTSPRRLHRIPLLVFKLVIFTLGATALYVIRLHGPAFIFEIVACVNLALAVFWDHV